MFLQSSFEAASDPIPVDPVTEIAVISHSPNLLTPDIPAGFVNNSATVSFNGKLFYSKNYFLYVIFLYFDFGRNIVRNRNSIKRRYW